ncbi:MAG TPA: tetratricopeptide repeat protein, partial [Herpetosiphonaceae bacterium]|nr:tetratricopeptide repeat protein [Herpetosiphonaceae bacterium]
MNSQLGNVHAALAAGNRAEARRLLERELQYNPSNGEVWYLLGQAVDDPAQRQEYFARAQSLGYVPQGYAQPAPGYAPRPA